MSVGLRRRLDRADWDTSFLHGINERSPALVLPQRPENAHFFAFIHATPASTSSCIRRMVQGVTKFPSCPRHWSALVWWQVCTKTLATHELGNQGRTCLVCIDTLDL